MKAAKRLAFTGHIAGLGTGIGDVMVQTADGERILLAPTEQIAEFVSSTYTFDSTEIGPVSAQHTVDGFSVSAPGLDVAGRLGGPAVGAATACDRADVAAGHRSRRVPADPRVRTAGSAGKGRREYYGVRRTRRIADVDGTFRGVDLGGLAPLYPPSASGSHRLRRLRRWSR
ncbi:MAG TPA: hypothetical protein VET27_21400 [Mycobacterium sp.]|nr:hypothetical protein [Mycobacterium sp.]